MSDWNDYTNHSEYDYLSSNQNSSSYQNQSRQGAFFNSNYYQPNNSPYERNLVDTRYYTNNAFSNRNSQDFQGGGPSVTDVSRSTLTPTAKEFKPSSSSNNTNFNNGAVKKNASNKWNDNYNQNDGRKGKKKQYQNQYRYGDDKKPSYNNYSRNYNSAPKEGEFVSRDREESKKEKDQYGDNKQGNASFNYKKDNSYNKTNHRKGYYEQRGFKNEAYANWRKAENAKQDKKFSIASQRERLEEMVTRKTLECLVCCEKIRHADAIWSCKQCFHIFHLSCIVKWAQASKLDSGWRCPACQNVCSAVPNAYHCFCGKLPNPETEPGILPHSCGEVCKRKGRICEHLCTLLCHPGPCPECELIVPKPCGCGATKPLVKCGSDVSVTCHGECKKRLKCRNHFCTKPCHADECEECAVVAEQRCFCGKQGRTVNCAADVDPEAKYDCGDLCGKPLACGNHTCEQRCHAGECASCALGADVVKTCPCGQTALSEARTSCLDPIKCCDKICNKPLQCGQPSEPHLCKNVCHSGPCPTCPLSTLVRCRCGHMDREIVCAKLTTKADDARCEKKCTKKRQCAKHRCNQLCCIDLDHECPLICNRGLPCGSHRCEEPCHRGRCPPCWRSSFQELYCECGASVLYPPIACGTRPPPCSQPCSRPRSCPHPPHHNCHPGPCPPCAVFCKRLCHGGHEQRAAIPCHQPDFSCGLACGRDMACGRHRCVQACHAGDCPTVCVQACAAPRAGCGHPCGQPCHESPCPETPCKQTVRVSCECGHRTSTRVCVELAGEYRSIALSQLASKMAEIQRGQTVDISDIVSGQKKAAFKTLECNKECKVIDRNRRLAIGLQIRNPDLSQKLTPRYSEYMRTWAKKDPKFCQHVHDRLTELVQLAKQSKQKSRSHSFESMNRDKRHLVHEYCEHFGCESAAYDQEPNRNVVATALRDKSWLPSVSVLELLERESRPRRVPGPVLSKAANPNSETVSVRLSTKLNRPATPPGEFVDYFNDPPT